MVLPVLVLLDGGGGGVLGCVALFKEADLFKGLVEPGGRASLEVFVPLRFIWLCRRVMGGVGGLLC